jgi:formamidopyrimidine-DNA glycosylase
VPELPEVEALAAFLRERAVGTVLAQIEVASVSVLKTFDPPLSAFAGLQVTDVVRHGKFIDIDVDGFHLVFHLARAGWLRWSDQLPGTKLRLSGSPISVRVRLDAGRGPNLGFDLTEAGTHKGVALYAVRDPQDVPGIAALGPDALAEDLRMGDVVAGKRVQVKRLLRDQKVIAGIGNAYSDEILHAAQLSPFAIAADLKPGELARLDDAIRDVLTDALGSASGKAAADLKDNKRSRMRVHGRTGEPCPVCGTAVAEVAFADSSLQYCPTCQTGGKALKDRSTSKFLK